MSSVQNRDLKGLLGLKNLGNTCFINCVVQCLVNTRDLRDYCLSNAYKADLSSTSRASKSLMEQFALLTESLLISVGRLAISPKHFAILVQRIAPQFNNFDKQDAQEFLHFLLDGLHNEVKRSFGDVSNEENPGTICLYDSSKIAEIFLGSTRSTLTCTVCSFKSTVFEPFWDISIPIKHNSDYVTLEECLMEFTKLEILDGVNRPTCNNCQTWTKATKKLDLHTFPQTLIIHLNRLLEPGKPFTLVTFPIAELRLQEFSAENSECPVYELQGVCNFVEDSEQSHYTAYCRKQSQGEWYCFDDCRVRPISLDKVCTRYAYVLFYELVSSSKNN